jgi:hypothetical protein
MYSVSKRMCKSPPISPSLALYMKHKTLLFPTACFHLRSKLGCTASTTATAILWHAARYTTAAHHMCFSSTVPTALLLHACAHSGRVAVLYSSTLPVTLLVMLLVVYYLL